MLALDDALLYSESEDNQTSQSLLAYVTHYDAHY